MSFSKKYSQSHSDRFQKTLSVMKDTAPPPQKVLELGPPNPMGEILKQEGYKVTNTPDGVDLDYFYDADLIKDKKFDLVTSFEIFEHMVNPFSILSNFGANKIITTVPLNLWFAKAYWNDSDPFDRHYHEFESRQFDMLLSKSGWKILYKEKWLSKPKKIGIRPLLRRFTPRYYLVVAERASSFKQCEEEEL